MAWENQGVDWQEWQIFLEGIIPCDPHIFCLLLGAGLGLSTSTPGFGFAPGELHSGIVSQGLAGAALSSQGSVTLAWDPPQTIKMAQGEVNNLVYEAVKPSLLFFKKMPRISVKLNLKP